MSVSMSVSCVGSSWWTRRVDRTKQRFDKKKRQVQSNSLSTIWLQRYTSLHTYTASTLPSSAIFIFRALRPCDQDSPISVWKPVYLIRAFVYHEWWATERDSTPDSFVYSKGKHTFLERRSLKNTWTFMRLIEVKEKARVFEGQARIQSSESDSREEEVQEWKHDVSFNRLATVYCTLLYYNCQLKLAYSLVFIFYFCPSFLMKVFHSHLTWLDPGESIPQASQVRCGV